MRNRAFPAPCIGLAVYELTAVARRYELKTCGRHIYGKISEYRERLKNLEKDPGAVQGQWADFIERSIKKQKDSNNIVI